MPPLEVWEKVLVDAEALANDVHGYISCIECHGGQDVADKEAAHEGMIHDPSVDAEAACGDCHIDIAPYQHLSLHNNLAGYDTVLHQRSSPENHATIEEGEFYHCNDCHTTCGQCHISQPTSVGGGLMEGHAYNAVPSMSRQCTACHGSRVKNEYMGLVEGLSPDVHFRSARMVCTDCHTGGDMHGTEHINSEEGIHDHRYDGEQGPSCESCHEDQVGIGSGNPYHEAHGTEVLSCQTCHSIEYVNCYDCHLERSEEDVPFFRLQEEHHGFYIGLNPRRTAERPYRYVPLRHVPTWDGLFQLYGEDVLDNFENLPTWTYATPHNIQRNTPQTESCESCHGNDEFFLTPDRIREGELEQNAPVIVPEAPPVPETYGFIPEDAPYERPGEEAPAEQPTDPLDQPPDPLDESSDPLDQPPDPLDEAAPTTDPLDEGTAPTTDPLDEGAAPTTDPLDEGTAPAPTTDPLDQPVPTVDPLDAAS